MKKDEFFWLNAVNRATVVTGLRNGQFGEDLARRAAAGIAAVEAMGEADPALRVKSYIAWEPLLIKAAGQGVTAIHAGRSSQDILSTQRTAILRDETLEFAAGLEDVIGDLLALAERHVDTIVPSYTNGVAAQPTSYAHHLLGIAASLLRVRERLSECHTRFNMCAMGATVLNGTGWPLDRDAMAAALGFPRPVENALDATSLAPVDMPLEVASALAAAAVRIGSMVDDIMVQYAQPRPWIILQEGGENTYVSSAMPQKRNPGLMNNCREDCSDVIGEMNAAFLRAHNVVPGMIDGKRPGNRRPPDARPRSAVSHRPPHGEPHGRLGPRQQRAPARIPLCADAPHLPRGGLRGIPRRPRRASDERGGIPRRARPEEHRRRPPHRRQRLARRGEEDA